MKVHKIRGLIDKSNSNEVHASVKNVKTGEVYRDIDDVFDYIIVSIGVNDITGLTPIRTWRRNLATLLDVLERHSPDALIAVAGIPPLHVFPLLPQPLRAAFGMRGRVFEGASRSVLNSYERSSLVPLNFEPHPSQFAPDGYHPSEESYAEFAEHIAERLLTMKAEHRGI